MGRPLGSTNKTTVQRQLEEQNSGKLMPLDYLLEVVRNPKVPRRERVQAAQYAAPFLHSKLTSTEIKGPNNGPVQVVIAGSDKGLL